MDISEQIITQDFIDSLLPEELQSRAERIPEKHYVYMFGAVWPSWAESEDARRALRDTIWVLRDDEKFSGLISALVELQTQSIEVEIVFKIVRPNIGYYLEFADAVDATKIKLSYF